MTRPEPRPAVRRWLIAGSLAVASLGGCANMPTTARPGLLDVLDRPGERALMNGIRSYEDGAYADSEASLGKALKAGLDSARDRAAAEKYLAFIYCTSNRERECEAAFRAAIQADPGFDLSRGEAGHPLWGPVFKRVRGR